MRILAINGSHRQGRNTATMLKLVLEEAQGQGAETELVELSGLSIRPCTACNRCLRGPICSVQDDMKPLADKMLSSDAIILGSPVYFGNVTGLMKNFMDRTRFLHMSENLLEGRIGAGLTIAGLRNGGQETTLQIIERFLQSHGLILTDSRGLKEGIYNLGAVATLYDHVEEDMIHWNTGVLEDSLAVRQCRQLGRNLVRSVEKFCISEKA